MIKKLSISILFFFLLLCGVNNLWAQKEMNYPVVKSTLEKHFYQHQWDALIDYADKAMDRGFDFYQMHFYVGSAHFEKGRYFTSIHYLEKARKQNYLALNDSIFAKYLYHAYLCTYQNGLAEEVRERSGLASLPKATKLLTAIEISAGIGLPQLDEDSYRVEHPEPSGGTPPVIDPYYRDMNYLKENQLGNVSVTLQPHKQLSIWSNYSYFNNAREVYISGPRNEVIDAFSLTQSLIYLGLQYQINPYWNVYAGGNYFNYIHAHSVYDGMDPLDMLLTKMDTLTQNNHLVYVSLSRQHKNLNLGIHGSYALIDKNDHWQGGINLTYYPWGNSKYYSISHATAKLANDTIRVILEETFGLAVGKSTWLELSGVYGDMTNYVNFGGANVYNLMDELNWQFGLSVKQGLGKHLLLTLSADYLNKTNYYVDIKKPGDPLKTQSIEYKQINIIGGLKWIF